MRDSIRHRYIGLALSGAKNQKTVIAVIEHYPKEKKTFLLDIYDHIPLGDEPLIQAITELREGPKTVLATNAPLSLPDCLLKPEKSKSCPSTKWAEKFLKSIHKKTGVKPLGFLCYTQRPIELFVRYQILESLHPAYRFDIDETMGGTKAPLAARMHYLKQFLTELDLLEIWPKLTVSVLGKDWGLSKRELTSYRKLDQGNHARERILEGLCKAEDFFIYERDLKKLSESLQAFDSFICAYTALLHYTGQTETCPKGFPKKAAWIAIPK